MKLINIIPNTIYHYSRGLPFLSITNVPDNQRLKVIENLNESNTWGVNRFSDSAYLKQRFETEIQLRKFFIKKGGKPLLKHPIYFFLGRNFKFEEHQANKAYKINLDNICKSTISFTYGDSMIAFNKVHRSNSGLKYQNPLCGKIFTFEDLNQIYTSLNYPNHDPLHIEAQLWIKPEMNIVEIC